MSVNSRLRQLERIIGRKPAPTESEPMGRRLVRATPNWQLMVLVEAQQGRHGEDSVRITQLFGLISAILERQVRSSALPRDLPIPEMLADAVGKDNEARAAVHELRELLQTYGDPKGRDFTRSL